MLFTIVEIYAGPLWRGMPLATQTDLGRVMEEHGINIYESEGTSCDWVACDFVNDDFARKFADGINALRGYSAKLIDEREWKKPIPELRSGQPGDISDLC